MQVINHPVRFALVGLFLVTASHPASCGVPLFSFETEMEIARWTVNSAQTDTFLRSDKFATDGLSSLFYSTPAWQAGQPEWPSFEVRPSVTDWREFDRLVFDVVNPESVKPWMSMFISDSKVPFRQGLATGLDLPVRGYNRIVIPLSSFPEKVDKSDISIIHLFTQRPTSEMKLYFDNLTLLRPGEVLPEPPSSFARQLAQLALTEFGTFKIQLDDMRQKAILPGDNAYLKSLADHEFNAAQTAYDSMSAMIDDPEMTLADMSDCIAFMRQALGRSDRVPKLLKLAREQQEAQDGVLVGIAPSTKRLMPQNMPFDMKNEKTVDVSLARNEKESFQIGVLPITDNLSDVQVSVSDLKTRDGQTLDSANIQCDVVGFVETKQHPPYPVSYVGWWPDPILNFLGPVDIAQGDLQSFWIRVRAPKDQVAGQYLGTITVSGKNMTTRTMDLRVRIYSFNLPNCTPLPTAISFFENPPLMGGQDNWQEMKFEYAEFLADYYIDYDSLYRNEAPDWEIITRLHDEGKLCAFNLGNVFNGGVSEEGFDQAIADTVSRLQIAYDKAKDLGVLDHAYIYGFDERGADQFGVLERSAQALKKAFPDVILMTTSYDHSFGVESEVNTIDAWCPLTPSYNQEQADIAREYGKYVWWYICCGPHPPFANWFIECDALESRLLMGAMAAKYQPDGFLYYALTIWNDNKPIEEGPFTSWNPVSWTTYHGDGSLFYSGNGGKPVPSIRLENYRDGQEDYAYSAILRSIIAKVEAQPERITEQDKWLVNAKAALEVPSSMIETMAQYSHDETRLQTWRDGIAEAIEASGMSDIDPWGDDYGVRGFNK